MKKKFKMENLDCAHCAAKMEEKIGEISGIEQVSITFATKQLRITAEEPDKYLEEIRKICTSIESQVQVVPREIHAKVMGEIQIEILKSVIKERFNVDVEFGTGNIVYKETIRNTVEGVGHFEPLRHYAEVHLFLEPAKRGSGIIIATECSEDVLDKNWQRLIFTHLLERTHRGVLTGSALTDVKITLAAGRAHLKHTEGGDFRQSTYRAVRQGLKEAGCRLLEPYYAFRLEVPAESIGRQLPSADTTWR